MINWHDFSPLLLFCSFNHLPSISWKTQPGFVTSNCWQESSFSADYLQPNRRESRPYLLLNCGPEQLNHDNSIFFSIINGESNQFSIRSFVILLKYYMISQEIVFYWKFIKRCFSIIQVAREFYVKFRAEGKKEQTFLTAALRRSL